MDTLEKYNNYWDSVCANHKVLASSARIALNGDPFDNAYDLREFMDTLRVNVEPPIMLIVAYDARYLDAHSDNKLKIHDGAIILLDRCKKKEDYEEIEGIYRQMEEVGEQCMAYTKYLFDQNRIRLDLQFNDWRMQRIGPVPDDYFGSRFDFSYMTRANVTLKFDQTFWNSLPSIQL